MADRRGGRIPDGDSVRGGVPGAGRAARDRDRPTTRPDAEEFRRDCTNWSGRTTDEWRHLKVEWLTDVVAARKKAAAEDKPIIICYTGGAGYNEPLGVC